MGELKDPSLARLQRGLPRQRKENAENYESDDLDMHAFAPTLVDGLTCRRSIQLPVAPKHQNWWLTANRFHYRFMFSNTYLLERKLLPLGAGRVK
jgi:hypothetical protein